MKHFKSNNVQVLEKQYNEVTHFWEPGSIWAKFSQSMKKICNRLKGEKKNLHQKKQNNVKVN